MSTQTPGSPGFSGAAKAKSAGWRRWLPALAVIGIAFWGAHQLHLEDRLRLALDAVARLGPWAPVLFVVLYVVATVLFLPGSALTLGAGAIFGVVWGSIYVSIGSTLGATAAFLIGRYLARDAIARRIAGNERFAAIDRAVAGEGWKIVGLTRLSPVFPFTLLNYAFGLTRVTLRDYIVASWIGMMPGTVMYVYLGSIANAASTARARTPSEWGLYGIGLIATVIVTVLATRIAQEALARKIPQGNQPGTS